MPQISLLRDVCWHLARALTNVILIVFFRLRAYNLRHLRNMKPSIFVCNHTSILDLLVGSFGYKFPPFYIARDTLSHGLLYRLFTFPFYTIPIKRDTADVSVIRNIEAAIKAGRHVLMFPEGTRTRTGEIGPFKGGFILAARRAKCDVVPIAIHGVFRAMPPHTFLPRPTRISIIIGRPIPFGKVTENGARTEVVELFLLLRRKNGNQEDAEGSHTEGRRT